MRSFETYRQECAAHRKAFARELFRAIPVSCKKLAKEYFRSHNGKTLVEKIANTIAHLDNAGSSGFCVSKKCMVRLGFENQEALFAALLEWKEVWKNAYTIQVFEQENSFALQVPGYNHRNYQ